MTVAGPVFQKKSLCRRIRLDAVGIEAHNFVADPIVDLRKSPLQRIDFITRVLLAGDACHWS